MIGRHRIAVLRAVMAGALLLAISRPADAQAPGTAIRTGRLTVSGGIVLDGGYPVGDLTAELRRNAPGTPSPFVLLRAESDLERAFGADLRVAYALGRAIAIEGGGGILQRTLAVNISSDPEAASTVADERVRQYTVDASVLYQLPGSALGDRVRPYVIGGGGYLRQLDDERLRAHGGYTIHGGAGVHYWLRPAAPRRRPMGVRIEARLVHRSGGIEFEDRSRRSPALSVLGFIGL